MIELATAAAVLASRPASHRLVGLGRVEDVVLQEVPAAGLLALPAFDDVRVRFLSTHG